MPNLLLHLPRLLPRQRRCFPYRLACARCGFRDLVSGEALILLPLAFEGARCFRFQGGGGVGIGSGGHCGRYLQQGVLLVACELLLDDCGSDMRAWESLSG